MKCHKFGPFSAATSSIEKPHVVVNPSPVVEGMNVTFECFVHFDIGVFIDLRWDYPRHIQVTLPLSQW